MFLLYYTHTSIRSIFLKNYPNVGFGSIHTHVCGDSYEKVKLMELFSSLL